MRVLLRFQLLFGAVRWLQKQLEFPLGEHAQRLTDSARRALVELHVIVAQGVESDLADLAAGRDE